MAIRVDDSDFAPWPTFQRAVGAAQEVGAAAGPLPPAPAPSGGGRKRPAVRVGDTVFAPWGRQKEAQQEGDLCEGLVTEVHGDGSLDVSFTGAHAGWMERGVPHDHCRATLEPEPADSEPADWLAALGDRRPLRGRRPSGQGGC